MANPITNYEEYVKDSRKPCKYGDTCYQKNKLHLSKYKHPPENSKNLQKPEKHINKRLKLDTSDEESTTKRKLNPERPNQESVANNDISDSEDSDIEKHDRDNVVDKEKENVDNAILDSNQCKDNDKNISIEEIDANLKKNDGRRICIDEKTEPQVLKLHIKEKFLVDMPEDFYKFWHFCKKLKSKNIPEALKEIGLTLVGPFDLLAGKFNNVEKSDKEYLIHWRYFRDPPELQTVLRGDDGTGFHMGYFRDSPEEMPVFLVGNHAKKNGILIPMGENIFSAVNIYLDDLKKTGDPFKRMHIGRIQSALTKEAEILKMDLSRKTMKMIDREKKIITRTFNKVGLVVPYDKKSEVGYRELALDNKALNILLTKLQTCSPDLKPKYLSELQPVFTYASIAADECDFGTGIELGWNIIAHGVDCLNETVMRFLVTGYQLLNKNEFAKIAEAHMKNRKQGCRLSIL